MVIAWCGMRGIVTLATALALPQQFPFRDLILFTAFAIVLGTLVLQGATLRPLMLLLRLGDDGLVTREVELARQRTTHAAIARLENTGVAELELLRREYSARLHVRETDEADRIVSARWRALRAEREVLLALRARGEIGDEAFHIVEQEIDWMEMYVARRLAPDGGIGLR
jgi:CPA1 family monovalent cation:H+ antiporter